MRRILFLLPVLSTLLCPLAAEAESYLVVSTCGVLPRTPSLGSADGPIGIDQTGKLCVSANVTVPPISIATPLAVNVPLTNSVVSGAYADGSLFTIGSVADPIYGGSGSATIDSILKGVFSAIKNLTVTTSIATPLAVNMPLTNSVVSGAYADGSLFTIGSVADAVYGGSGSATVDSILKGIYSAIKNLTVTTSIATPLAVTITNTPVNVTFATPIAVTQSTSPWVVTGTALQGTTPWVVSPNNITPVSQSTVPWIVNVTQIITPLAVTQSTSPWVVTGTALQGTTPWVVTGTALQGTSPWVVTGTVLQGTLPWVVSPNNITPVSQSTNPWVVSPNNITPVSQSTVPWVVSPNNITPVSQNTSPWITQDNAVNVRRVVPNTASQFALVATGSTPIATAVQIGGVVSSSESPKYSPNTIGGFFLDLVGKHITSPYANRENYVTGAVSSSGITVASIIPTPTILSYSNYITDFGCMRSDAGTTSITVTTNDTNTSGIQGATVWVVPNNGGGGGFLRPLQVPLKVAAGTAFQIKPQQAVSSLYCNANGYVGY
jgi:hypothetical protein